MARDSQPEYRQAFGLPAWREPGEAFDGRPWVIARRPFWKDRTEELTFMDASEANQHRPGEGPMAHVQRIAALATGKLAQAVKPMTESPYPDDAALEAEKWRQKQALATKEEA